ncbi:MAG: DUF29 domain-containing protein [Caulobacteraceae bacterium]
MADDLYDQDFYLWTQAQAAALRARAGDNALDYEHLAEEVEDLGKAERNRAESHIRQIIAHLYKITATRNAEPIGHWRVEILEHRIAIKRNLTGAIRRELESNLETITRDALRIAKASMAAHEPDVTIDAAQSWTLAQILGEVDDLITPWIEL